MSISYSDFTHNSDGSYSKKVNLISINFKKYDNYRKNWDLEDIIHFEVMLVHARGYPDEFYFQEKRLSDLTRISTTKLKQCRDKLVNLGFLEVSRGGKNNKNWYTINYETIKNNLHKIYDFSDLDETDKKGYQEMMKRFFDYFQDYNHTAINKHKEKKEEDDELNKLKSTPLMPEDVTEDVELVDSGFEDLPDEIKKTINSMNGD